jgi:glutamine synthetase
VDVLIDKGEKKEIAIMHIIQKFIVESKEILFEGDGYSEEWQKEAEKRKLPNIRTTPLALDIMISKKAKDLFERNKVYTHAEIEARHEIALEKYIKKVQIEARIIGDLALNHIIPAAIKYQNQLLKNITGLKTVGLPESAYAGQLAILTTISTHIQVIYEKVNALVEARKVVNVIEDTRSKAIAYNNEVKDKFFNEIRYHVDKLENLVDDEYWSLPKYREMLFLR